MSLPVLLLMCPCGTTSGYGARSRDIATALIESGKYDVRIWSTRWGNTPMNALDPNIARHKAIIDRLMLEPEMSQQPDIFIQVTVPNEFQRLGRFNIGITAGIETTIASAPWIDGCNRMDLVLTSSEHSKKVFESTVWTENHPHQGTREIKLTKPVEVLFEGVDLEIYHKTSTMPETIASQLAQIKESSALLFVGHWLKGNLGEDRKNVGLLIQCFLEAFKNKASYNQPALILKTSHADFSPIDKKEIETKIGKIIKSVKGKTLPNIYLLHGDLSDHEINALYNHPKIKAHITLTKGEGYGRPLAEASLSEKVVIAPNWSGLTDFMKHALLLPGRLTNVDPSATWENVILPESQWMSVDPAHAVAAMKEVVEHPDKFKDLGKKQAKLIKTRFNLDQMATKLIAILEARVLDQPKQIPLLNLPQLPKLQPLQQTN